MFRSVRLPQGISGRLYLHSMPGRRESWDDFVGEAEQRGIDFIVCLASDDEIQEKSPAYANAISNNLLSCKREAYPILDYGVPEDQGVLPSYCAPAALYWRIAAQGSGVQVPLPSVC